MIQREKTPFSLCLSTKTLGTQLPELLVRVISKPLSKMITVLGIFKAPYFEDKSAKDALGECFTCHKERRRVSNSIHSLGVYFQQLPVEKIDCAQSTHTHSLTSPSKTSYNRNPSSSPLPRYISIPILCTYVYPLPIQLTVHPN